MKAEDAIKKGVVKVIDGNGISVDLDTLVEMSEPGEDVEELSNGPLNPDRIAPRKSSSPFDPTNRTFKLPSRVLTVEIRTGDIPEEIMERLPVTARLKIEGPEEPKRHTVGFFGKVIDAFKPKKG